MLPPYANVLCHYVRAKDAVLPYTTLMCFATRLVRWILPVATLPYVLFCHIRAMDGVLHYTRVFCYQTGAMDGMLPPYRDMLCYHIRAMDGVLHYVHVLCADTVPDNSWSARALCCPTPVTHSDVSSIVKYILNVVGRSRTNPCDRNRTSSSRELPA